MASPEATDPFRSPFRYLPVLLAGASYWPWHVIATNPTDLVRPDRMIVIVVVAFAFACAWFALLVRIGLSRSNATLATLITTVVLMVGGPAVTDLGGVLGPVALVLSIFAIPLWLRRVGRSKWVVPLTVGLVVSLVSGPALKTMANLGADESAVVSSGQLPVSQLSSTPDIVLVVLDSYPGRATWLSDLAHVDNDLFTALEERGFEVPLSAWTTYPWTQMSVPSLLEMNYPVEVLPSDASRADLYRLMSGDGAFVRVLDQSGYRVAHVGSGWSGFFCGPVVDVCVGPPFTDEMAGFTLSTSVFSPLFFRNKEHAFTVGSLNAMNWAKTQLGGFVAGEEPSFTMIHLMLPHEPLLLDRQCRPTPDRVMSAYALTPTRDIASLDSRLGEQVACVNQFVTRLADALPEETTIVVVSDHGFDRRYRISGEWNLSAMEERLNVLVAVRTGLPQCEVGNPVIIPNLLRRILDCMAPEEVEDLAPRMFMSDLEELGEVDVARLLALPSRIASGSTQP